MKVSLDQIQVQQESKSKPKLKLYQVNILFIYHVVLAVVLAYLVYNVWPPQPWPGDASPPPMNIFGMIFQPHLESRLILLVLLTGAMGSYLHAASSFVDYLGNRSFVSSWIWWYLLKPFVGMLLALIFYFVFRGGFVTTGFNAAGESATNFINPFGIAAMSALVGMFSKVATDKLNEVFTTLFRPAPGEGDQKRFDKLENPTTTEETSIRISEADFEMKAKPEKLLDENQTKAS